MKHYLDENGEEVMLPDPDEGVIRWDMSTLSLTSNMDAKARRLVRDGCVHKIDDETWEVWPIKGKSKLTHIVHREKDGALSCTCQRWRTKGLTCTHIIAVLVSEGKYEVKKPKRQRT